MPPKSKSKSKPRSSDVARFKPKRITKPRCSAFIQYYPKGKVGQCLPLSASHYLLSIMIGPKKQPGQPNHGATAKDLEKLISRYKSVAIIKQKVTAILAKKNKQNVSQNRVMGLIAENFIVHLLRRFKKKREMYLTYTDCKRIIPMAKSENSKYWVKQIFDTYIGHNKRRTFEFLQTMCVNPKVDAIILIKNAKQASAMTDRELKFMNQLACVKPILIMCGSNAPVLIIVNRKTKTISLFSPGVTTSATMRQLRSIWATLITKYKKLYGIKYYSVHARNVYPGAKQTKTYLFMYAMIRLIHLKHHEYSVKLAQAIFDKYGMPKMAKKMNFPC